MEGLKLLNLKRKVNDPAVRWGRVGSGEVRQD